jgi:hypothetical protein
MKLEKTIHLWKSFSGMFNQWLDSRKTIVMWGGYNHSTTCFQRRDFSSHKPHILDPGDSTKKSIQKLAVPEQLLQVPHFNFFIDSRIFPVGSGLQNTETTLARPQGSLEEENLISKEKTKFEAK